MEKKKILMVTERYLPIWGGAENQLCQLIPHLIDKGCNVEVVTRKWRTDLLAEEMVNNVRVRRLGIPGDNLLATLIFVIQLLMHLIIAGKRFNILHSHGVVNMGVLCKVATLVCRNKNVIKIATGGKIPSIQQTITGKISLCFFNRSDAVIGMTEEIKKELIKVGFPQQKIFSIPNAVDCSRFIKETEKNKRDGFRKKHSLPRDALLVLYVGRIVKRKGLDILLKAWKDISLISESAYLIIVGSGDGQSDSVEDELKTYVDHNQLERVIFAGAAENPEEVYVNCDLFVFPSRQEGFPNALMEAMASSLPVIASKIGGNVELVADKETGLLFEPEDHSQLAELATGLIGSKHNMERLGNAARQSMVECYDFPSVSARYSDLYDSLLQ